MITNCRAQRTRFSVRAPRDGRRGAAGAALVLAVTGTLVAMTIWGRHSAGVTGGRLGLDIAAGAAAWPLSPPLSWRPVAVALIALAAVPAVTDGPFPETVEAGGSGRMPLVGSGSGMTRLVAEQPGRGCFGVGGEDFERTRTGV